MIEAEVLDSIQPFTGFETEAHRDESEAGHMLPMQQVKTAYTTAVAVQKPRSITRVAHNVLQEASLAGSSFYYRWTVKDKHGKTSVVQGGSVDLAMSLARCYGNCALDAEVVQESPTHYLIRGAFIDLETGFTCPRLFRQRKSQGIGKFDKDRQEDIVFQIGQSKAVRNAILRSMPSWLIDQAIDVAMAAELKKVRAENPTIARTKVLAFFSGYGITQEAIEAKIGRPADLWTEQDIVDLRGGATAIKEGRIAPAELFPPITAQQPDPQPTGETVKQQNQAKERNGAPASTRAGKKQPHKSDDDMGTMGPDSETKQEQHKEVASGKNVALPPDQDMTDKV